MPFAVELAIVIITLIVLSISLYLFIRASYSFAPWVPSKLDLLRQALSKRLPPHAKRFVDLGSGDGRAVFLASKQYNLEATGYEISPIPFALSKLRQLCNPQYQVQLYYQDLYSADLQNYDVIYIYGLPKKIQDKLIPKLNKELRPGTLVLSYNFSLPGKKPIKIYRHRWRRLLLYSW